MAAPRRFPSRSPASDHHFSRPPSRSSARCTTESSSEIQNPPWKVRGTICHNVSYPVKQHFPSTFSIFLSLFSFIYYCEFHFLPMRVRVGSHDRSTSTTRARARAHSCGHVVALTTTEPADRSHPLQGARYYSVPPSLSRVPTRAGLSAGRASTRRSSSFTSTRR